MKRIINIISIIICLFILFSSCNMKSGFQYQPNTTGEWDINNSPLNNAPFLESKSIYENDYDDKMDEIYLTILPGKDDRKKPIYSFSDLNNYTGDGKEPYCDVIISEGKNGDSSFFGGFGFGESMANGKIFTKGNVSTIKPRSYQIKLYDRAGLYKGVKTINLIKELDDLSRMKEKLCFDLLKDIPDIASFRTRFTHVFVKDTTSQKEDFVDMGIFTYVEQPNKDYLSSRNFDAEGNLYKAKDFDFSRNDDHIFKKADPKYNKEKFEEVLTIREGTPDQILIDMLDSLNDEKNDINEVIKKYFNEENILTYAAVNILFSNFEAFDADYLIYNPRNSNTFYLFPGAFKKAFDNKIGAKGEKIPSALVGYSMLNNNVLFRRFFEIKDNVEKLIDKVNEIHKKINGKSVNDLSEKYKNDVLKILYSVPELFLLPKQAEAVEPYIDSLGDVLEENYNLFLDNAQRPIPPYITECKYNDNNDIVVKWNDIHTVSENDISQGNYIVEIATTSDMSKSIYITDKIYKDNITISGLDKSKYFIRVTFFDGFNTTQQCSNISKSIDGRKYYGCVVLEL